MERFSTFILILSIIVAGFLLLHVYDGPDERIQEATQNIENAEESKRCAAFRQELSKDSSIWSLGYAGRIRQLVRGCF